MKKARSKKQEKTKNISIKINQTKHKNQMKNQDLKKKE